MSEKEKKDDAMELCRLREENARLKFSLDKEKECREAERKGRIAAEKSLRNEVTTERGEWSMRPIGTVKSCFPDRRGTPRQPLLCPSTRSCICFENAIPPASLEGLDAFSHMFCIFLFHENTNMHKMANNKKSTFKAKIAPPQLGGRKIGVFSTRTPHRPNPVGLSVVRIERVDMKKRKVYIRGADLVDGTPILDVKPYLPFDSIRDYRVPSLYTDEAEKKFTRRDVIFESEAENSLKYLVKSTKFYTNDFDTLKDAIVECLSLDIRAVYQNRGKATAEMQQYEFHFDRLNILFETHEKYVLVKTISRLSAAVTVAAKEEKKKKTVCERC
jgi:tRNA (adenine37-N6)-methyltransferase